MTQLQLTPAQRKYLKSLAHHLDPVAQVGKEGISAKFLAGLAQAFKTRELLKVQLLDGAEIDKKELAGQVAESAGATLVTLIGFRVVLYRPNDKLKTRIVLPDPLKPRPKTAVD